MNRFHLGLAALSLTAAASAQDGIYSGATLIAASPISTSANIGTGTFNIVGDVYVTGGASLTIGAGSTMSSSNGTLVITPGCQIFAAGTADAPITWTSNLETGAYRPDTCQEWGNLTVMGEAYVNTCRIGTNTPAPNANNYGDMEGISPANPTDDDYGGNNDDDDSGVISHCSFRYGGRNVANGDELNGLSLGAVGRNTDIDHVDIFSNVDDGIEIWGGTVNLKYISIWFCGDDSFDIDQGWRGKAQFGLIVQGSSCIDSQGSGMGDNAIEMDGAEECSWQPVTTARIANFTVIGAPPVDQATGASSPLDNNSTDRLVELRDNVRVQFHNCIFMDAGEEFFLYTTDGEACHGGGAGCSLGNNLSLSLATTSASTTSANNPFAAPEITPAQAYQAQDASGNLLEFRNNKFFNNNHLFFTNNASSIDIFSDTGLGTNNANNTTAASQLVTQITRGPVKTVGSKYYRPVTFLDPTPAGEALTASTFVSDGGAFLEEAQVYGAFRQGNNWLIGWTAASQYGLTTSSRVNEPIHGPEQLQPTGYQPVHYTTGNWTAGANVDMRVSNGGIFGDVLVVGFNPVNPIAPFDGFNLGGVLGIQTLIPSPDFVEVAVGGGFAFVMPAGIPSGTTLWTQYLPLNGIVVLGGTNAQRHITP